MKKIRIVQVGTNGITHAAPTFDSIRKNSDTFEFLGICEPIEEWKKNLDTPRYRSVPHLSLEEAFALQPDAVAIETNEEEMTKYALMFAEKGISVHMDKPGSFSHKDFCRLADMLEEQNLPFHLGYMYRYNPLIRRAFDLIEKGKLGQILSVEAHMSCQLSAENKERLTRFPGGQMFYLGCHMLDLILRLQGEPKEVLPMNVVTGIDGVKAVDSAFAVLRYEKGVSFVKTSASEIGGFARRQLVILGTEGTLELKPLEVAVEGGLKSFGALTFKKDALPWADASTTWESEVYDRYDEMMLDFARQIRGEKEEVYTPEYEKRLHRLLLCACEENRFEEEYDLS